MSRALCLVGSDASRYAKLTADEQEVFKLIKRVRRLPAFFSNSSKRLEEYADVCEEIIEQCAGVSPNILKMVIADGSTDEAIQWSTRTRPGDPEVCALLVRASA